MPRFLLALALVACGSSHPATPDAPVPVDAHPDAALDAAVDAPPGPDLSCLGMPAPATAPDPLPVEGKLFAVDHYNVTPFAGATIVVHRRADDAALATVTTAADGSFTASIASGGAAVDAYFTATAAGFRPTRADPGDPLSGGENALLLVATDAELGRWYADANATYTPGDRVLVTAVVDCKRDAAGGSTVAVAPASPIAYYDDVAKHWDPALAASTNGFTLVTAPAASVTATAAIGTATFPPHMYAAPPGTLAIGVVTPHR